MTDNTKVWLHGLGAAAIGASGSSVATVLVAPDKFNLTSWAGFGHLIIVSLAAGVINAGAYLAKSPLPALTLEPGDKVNVQNPVLANDGTLSGSSATLTKASVDASK